MIILIANWNKKFKHQNSIKWGTTCMTAFLRLIEDNIKKWFEYFPIDMGLKFEQWIIEFGKFFKQKMLVKHA